MKRKTGVHVEFVAPDDLKDKAWDWQLDEGRITIRLDSDLFGHLSGQEDEAQPLVALMVSHAVEAEYHGANRDKLRGLFSAKWNAFFDEWSSSDRGIAPSLLRMLLQAVIKRKPQRPDLHVVN